MEYITISPTLTMSRITAGCMRAKAAGMDGEPMLRFVHGCLEMGITTFDHAPVYGGSGACEQMFGDSVLRREPGLRNQLTIVTKAGIVPPGLRGNRHVLYDSRKESLLAEIDASLLRLGTDHVDLLLVHRPDILINPAGTAEALDTIAASGKALNVGVSNYMPAQFRALRKHMKAPLVVNQMEFSACAVDNFFNGVIDTAQELGTRLMAWSPLGGGPIFQGWTGQGKDNQAEVSDGKIPENDGLTDAQREQAARMKKLRQELQSIAAAHGVGIDTILYAWLLKHPAKLMPVTGTMKIERIRAAVQAMDVDLTYDEWYGILAASRGFEVP